MAAPPRLALLLAASTLALGACGQTSKNSATSFSGDQKPVAQAVESLQSAGSKRDAAKICNDLLAPALVAKIKAASSRPCDSVLKDALSDADAFELQVKKVTLAGSTATAVVESSGGKKTRTDTLQLQKVGAAWKISSLGAR